MPRSTDVSQNPRPKLGRPEQWLRLAAILAIIAFGLHSAWQQQNRPHRTPPADVSQPETPIEQPRVPSPHGDQPADAATPASARTKILNQQIRDEDGEIIFRGDVDVGPTLARIERSGRLSYSHDGITFENRERRLPKQPPGYYKEYVHPTPGLRGPGPQRVVVGRGGEIYYTPDHYRTFQRLDQR